MSVGFGTHELSFSPLEAHGPSISSQNVTHRGVAMEKIPVLIVHGFKDDALSVLEPYRGKFLFRSEKAVTPDEVAAALDSFPDSEILYSIHTPTRWDSRWRLRWIQLHYAGADHVLFDIIPDRVAVTTVSGVTGMAIAEHAFALILALRRRIPEMLSLQDSKTWLDMKSKWKKFARPLLNGETVGILVYGSIGRQIGKIAQAFGMDVLACKRNPHDKADRGFIIPGTGDPHGTIPRGYYGPDRLIEMLRVCDIIVNALPATTETKQVIGRDAFAAMKQGAMFISVGRGATVDEGALIDSLETGHLFGAGIDVFQEEPLPPSHPFWRLDNVIISPHVSGFFNRYDELSMMLFRENLDRYLAGRPLLNSIDRQRGY
ncbi:MAG TPA: D-2-hydroxyacid dehydrogenase [Deltaproteobacteria bacterium]|nr:D-2-hydroxyacid dehydrogenase [Deltaproteobacteria bacterium]